MTPLLLALLSAPAFAQDDTGDTGDTSDTGVEVEAPPALAVPAGAVLTLPDGTETDLPEEGLLVLRKPPSLVEGITLVPAGSLVLLRGEDGSFEAWLANGKSFLLPEPMYDNARLQARQLKICKPALDKITETTLRMADRTNKALSQCDGQFDVDEVLIADLTGQVGSWETRALVAEDRLKVARRNQAVAWAITGGLVLGATSAIVLTVAN